MEPDPLSLRRILLATDFSRGAGRAKDYALFLAQTYGATVLVQHVSQPYPTLSADAVADPYLLEPIREQVSRVLHELTEQMGQTGVQATGQHTVGIASEEIIRTARENGIDLIVMGTQGRTGLDHVLLGSTAERVVKGAPCPVVTVRPPAAGREQDTVSVQRLLAPLDFSDSSFDALETALLLARRFAAPITLLHVLEWSWLRLNFTVAELAEDAQVRRDIEARAGRYADLLRAQGVTVETVIRGGGGPADFIVDTAEAQRSDLIVMGTHGRRGLQRALIGSVAESVLRRAPCPVWTVKQAKFSPGHRRVFGPIEQAA
ncbi:universal stress protein [Nitrospira moscoviensis]|uniref:Universal stress protein n=1 Tax=Nitrospira moscoviensis TaxID=42253 RepID=A0A0K2GDV9_NITMO|nr:universal stress protein [Nitrospira moscoviensis]ALA59145.1 Universal stress protein [Nitrospira moscoviensis]